MRLLAVETVKGFGFLESTSGSTISAPSVTMDKMKTLKIARVFESLGDSGFQPNFLGLFQVMNWQTPYLLLVNCWPRPSWCVADVVNYFLFSRCMD